MPVCQSANVQGADRSHKGAEEVSDYEDSR